MEEGVRSALEFNEEVFKFSQMVRTDEQMFL